jgi:F420-dependent oxidoreductase-like protein
MGVEGESSLSARIGIVVNRVSGVDNVIRATQQIEALGFGAAWLTNGGPEDCMPLIASLALRTSTIRLGTSVVQTYPRHPYVLATEANVIDQLAPGRFRLGVGPSHAVIMRALGLKYDDPFGHLREYVTVLRTLSSTGSVAFEGSHYRVTASLGRSFALPVMIGALQPKTFELAGAVTDGAITWLCPPAYLRDVGVPLLERGATAAGRVRPPLIAHLAACVHSDGDEVRDEVRRSVPNIGFPSYQRMLVAAGYPEASEGRWTDHLVDAIVAWGDEDAVASRIHALFDAGADEVLVRPIGAGSSPNDVVDRTIGSIPATI